MSRSDQNEPKQCVRCIVWALGMCFLFFFHVFHILINFFLFIWVLFMLKDTRVVQVSDDRQNGPK